jgi:uncharacterized protein with HEPN domain
MSKSDKLRVPEYLRHILEAIQRIERYTEEMTEAGFLENEMVQDAVIRNIEIMGEAANNIRQHQTEFAAQHPEVPWEDIYWMRNRVAHGYFKVDMEIVWKTIRNDLPELAGQVRALLGNDK